MSTLTIRMPDDWHVHFRDGEILASVAPFTAAQFGRAIVMPNLTPPIVTTSQATEYRKRILSAVKSFDFIPLMTCYLTDSTDVTDLMFGHKSGIFTAAKLYPAHATTNSAAGVTDVNKIRHILEVMAENGMPLLVHGELPRADIDIFDREKAFIDIVLLPLLEQIPSLKVVLEHITTEDGVAVVRAHRPRVGATITPQHLLFNRNAIFDGGLRPHMYCLPVLKREQHRRTLRGAATSGEGGFFLGTDSAPHLRASKESDCGCAGVFGAPAALSAYLRVFDEEGALSHFETFASINGPKFYGLPVNEKTITMHKVPFPVCQSVEVKALGEIHPLLAGEQAEWSIAKCIN